MTDQSQLHESLRQAVETASGNDTRQVHCTTCHRDQGVENGLRDGWPLCHGATMTIDSHADRCVPGGRFHVE
jgi:hypothetical protein